MSPFRDYSYTVGGWIGVKVSDTTILTHDGSNTFNYATALLVPSREVAVLVVTNQGGPEGPGQHGCEEARDALIKHVADTKKPR
jgi:hypothetical protein